MPVRERWLLSILTGVFVCQTAVLVLGVLLCFQPGLKQPQSCPEIGDRFEQTFNGMIATTLALLTGGCVASARRTSTPKPPTNNVNKTN